MPRVPAHAEKGLPPTLSPRPRCTATTACHNGALMRRTALLLALVLAGAALAACGKGGYTVTAVSRARSSTTAPSTGSTKRTPTPSNPGSRGAEQARRAQALAYVHAVNLTAADVPGLRPSHTPKRETSTEKRIERELTTCVEAGIGGGGKGAGSGKDSGGQTGEGKPKSGESSSSETLAKASSPDFEVHRGVLALTVSSEVSVARSAAQAATTLQAIHSPRLRACLIRYVTAQLKAQPLSGAKVVNVKADTGTPPAPGTTGGFAWRVTATLGVHGIELPFYFDILGFVDGPAQVTLTSTGTLHPFPATAQEQLYNQLLARARAHTP